VFPYKSDENITKKIFKKERKPRKRLPTIEWQINEDDSPT